MLKTYQYTTQCKGDIHSSKTANIILPELITEYRVAWQVFRQINFSWRHIGGVRLHYWSYLFHQ